jgi:hypothetical protein
VRIREDPMVVDRLDRLPNHVVEYLHLYAVLKDSMAVVGCSRSPEDVVRVELDAQHLVEAEVEERVHQHHEESKSCWSQCCHTDVEISRGEEQRDA